MRKSFGYLLFLHVWSFCSLSTFFRVFLSILSDFLQRHPCFLQLKVVLCLHSQSRNLFLYFLLFSFHSSFCLSLFHYQKSSSTYRKEMLRRDIFVSWLILVGRLWVSPAWSMMLAAGSFIQVGSSFLSISSLLRSYIMNRYWILSNVFICMLICSYDFFLLVFWHNGLH